MPLYECENCHAVDNTAIGNFWEQLLENKPRLCTECDPSIGKWHGKFDKITASDYAAKYPDARRIEYPARAPSGCQTARER